MGVSTIPIAIPIAIAVGVGGGHRVVVKTVVLVGCLDGDEGGHCGGREG